MIRDRAPVVFDLAPPPRRVPLSLWLRVFFGGGLNQFGWVVFGIGLLAFGTVGYASLRGWHQFRGPLDTIPGVIKDSWKTDASEGGGGKGRNKRPAKPIYAYSYSFTDAAGIPRAGVSYTLSTTPKPGDAVTIEYPQGDAAVSRVQGMRSSMHSAASAFTIIVPLIGLLLLFIGFRLARKAHRVLRDGLPAWGVLVDKSATNTTVNKKRVYKLTFEFTAENGEKHRAVARTHETQTLEDEARERLLYDPAQPDRSFLWDKLPGSPQIDGTGNLAFKHTIFAALALLLPLMVLLGIVGWWCNHSP